MTKRKQIEKMDGEMISEDLRGDEESLSACRCARIDRERERDFERARFNSLDTR